MRKIIIYMLSLVMVFAPAISYAASPSGWAVSPADIIISTAGNTITAFKGAGASALQSTVTHAPTVANIGKNIAKGAGATAVAFAVVELIGAGVDWVLDPANNRVKYFAPSAQQGDRLCRATVNGSPRGDPVTANAFCAARSSTFHSISSQNQITCNTGTKLVGHASICSGGALVEKYLPIPVVAQKVIDNSRTGHAPSQELIKTVIVDDVNAGVIDTPLNTNAIPATDTPTVNPPHDPTQPVPPFDPSSIIAAIKSVMAAVVNMSGILSAKIDALMIDLGIKQAETIEAITAGTGEIVAANDRTGAKVAEIVAAIEALEGNTLDGQVINDAVDRVIANDNVKVGDIVAAIEAIEGNTLDGQVINEAVDRVIANDNVNTQAAAEAADAAADKIIAADKAAADKAAADKAAADEYFKDTPPDVTPEPVVVDTLPPTKGASDFDVNYINFGGQCPVLPSFNIGVGGASSALTFDMTPLCDMAVKIRPAVIAIAYFIGLGVIASAIRET